MSTKFLVIGGDIYEMADSELVKYKLEGDALKEARQRLPLSDDGDVTGQSRLGEQSSSSSGSIYDGGRSSGKGY